MNKNVNIVYYVDIDDNTKGNICAIPSDIDMRDPNIIEKVANAISEVLSPIRPEVEEHKISIATAIAHHKFSNLYDYEFGVEEAALIER